MANIEQIILKLRSIIIIIRSSSNRLNSFKKICEENQVSYLCLNIDTPTRWNSTKNMIEKSLKLKIPISLFASSNSNVQPITLNDWDLLSNFLKLLTEFEKYSLFFESDSFPTIHMVICGFNKLFDALDDSNYDGASPAFRKLKKYYKKTDDSPIYYLSTLLNPQFKVEFLRKNNWEAKAIENIVSM